MNIYIEAFSIFFKIGAFTICLLYTSDAADE